jgi:ubiquitin-like-conjugating enzyme ATG10
MVDGAMACTTLATFPFLTPDEFDCACRALVERVRSCTAAQVEGGWSSARLVTQNAVSLKITKCNEVQIPALDDADLHEGTTHTQIQAQAQALEDEHEDPEALLRTNLLPTLQVDYDIVLSPTYQVPVLYFVLRWHNHPGPVGLDAVYQYVVPKQYRQQLQSVGVMGGISCGVGAHTFSFSDRRAKLGIVGFQGAHNVFVVSSRIWRSGLFCPPV